MEFITWATSPWGRTVPIHAAWDLIWLAVIAGLLFMIVHALYVAIVAGPRAFAKNEAPAAAAAVPERVPRHSLASRAFHWIMAASMLTLLFTAFLPKAGVQFNWVLYHWIAGVVLTASILFHVIHATFFQDFWSIWPDRIDMRDAVRRTLRFLGKPAQAPARFAKYPLENKFYHLVIVLAGLAVIGTGLFMMKRIQTVFFVRNPYLFSDMTWGLMYVLHGLAGIGLIALVMVHVYMGVRPEKLPITKSMIFG
ncbi:MAG: cytochrome b/b6 domain-containing protein, partial [Terracidiphilus sp.]